MRGKQGFQEFRGNINREVFNSEKNQIEENMENIVVSQLCRECHHQ